MSSMCPVARVGSPRPLADGDTTSSGSTRSLVSCGWHATPASLRSKRTCARSSCAQRSFDAAICLWGSFGYFDDDGNVAQARTAADALAPGGRYLIDTIVADTLLPRFQPSGTWEVGGVAVEELRRYHEDTRRIETTWTFTRDGERAVRTTFVRLYTVEELTDLLAGVGFASFQALDDDLAPFGSGAERLWLVATMPG